MKKYFTHGLLFSAIAFAIGLATGMGPIGDAEATDYNGLTSTKPAAVVKLGVPAQNTLPLAIISPAHGLEPAAYRARWKLPADHPIIAPTYSERRSTLAKQIGLGRPREAIVSTPAPEVIAPPAKRRGRKPRSAAAK
jgi:hypothetical protein